MTIGEIMDRIAQELAPIGWPVMPRPIPDTADPAYVEVGLGDVRVTPATVDSPGLSMTVLVGLYADMRMAQAYDALVVAMETALRRLASLTLFRDLEAQDVLIQLSDITAEGPIPVAQGPSDTGYWRTLVRVPVIRRRL